MPGPLLTVDTPILCMHGGEGEPVDFSPRVLIDGQPVVLQTSSYVIAGCPLEAVPSPFCVTAEWVVASLRVFSEGIPVLVESSEAVCAASGTGVIIIPTQFLVIGE